MIDKKLKVGDYIFSPNGTLARVIRVNKCSYTYQTIDKEWLSYTDNIKFNGIRDSLYKRVEFFVCDEPQAKALELTFERCRKAEELEEIKADVETLLDKVKEALKRLEI